MSSFALRGRILLGSALVPGAVVVEGERIAGIVRDPGNGDLPDDVVDGDIIAPGFIDLQVNGGFGCDVGDDPSTIHTLSRRLPESGVTAYLPTLITSPPEMYPRTLAAFDAARSTTGARPLGLHLEGPYLSPQRPGAHRRELIERADPALLDEMIAGDTVRLMTLAPERPRAGDLIRKLRSGGVLVSLGHTDATLEQFEAGVDAGAGMATHIFNAMSPFGHRAPNVVGAALTDDRIAVGLIADGIHCHPTSVDLAIRAKGVERIALVTDMMAAAGMKDGPYTLGGRDVVLRNGAVRLPDGTLAGSVLTMDEAVRNVSRWSSVSTGEALRMATEVPARLLGLSDRGRIGLGLAADLVVLDAGLCVRGTVIGGVWAHGGWE